MFKIKNILLPTDFSKTSLTASEYAVNLAKQYGAKLHVLHVLEKTPPILAIRSLDLSRDKIIKSINADAQAHLDECVKKIKKHGDFEITSVIRKGIDYEEIIKYTQEKKIDIIVIATHGRTGILHTLLGSVAEKVIRYSKIPVLVTTPSSKT
ncbi:MAG: universal stress protein [Ignavibacteriota bacterium]|jgi:nucleotide-binding universal stress UspA family protein|nr:MAG: universal stress protein [Ignavibacterium sp.]MBL1153919.1 universal stress protein [Ignavibacteriota bacterium]MCO6447845.1 universal stress protein [Ignavibacterium album]MCZ2269223.1 universal stress protein [Ignavibacteriales bacterium]MDX9711175.1 universal stress protein [Ignavibacteriaceae bacterium]